MNTMITTQRQPNVLVVDDETNVLKTIGICLDSIGCITDLVSKPLDAISRLREKKFDLALIDLKMTPIGGMELLDEIKKVSPETTVIIITAHGSIESAVEAIKRGAYNYIQKPFEYKELQLIIQRAWEYHALNLEVKDLKRQLTHLRDTGDIITKNKTMFEIIELARRVAASSISVLLEGESGTGKEVLANYIHKTSARSDKPFVKINCASIPDNLLESELFGHMKGSFTGAIKDRQGRFEVANGGTIFLDEIAEIAPSTQVKLLRVLQNKEFERIGDNVTRRVDVRIIAATNKNLDEALKEETIREDLFYRLNGVRIKMLPLRERPEDIPLLAQHFIGLFSSQQKSLSQETIPLLQAYRWPGNIRELENVMQRAVVLSKDEVIHVDALPEEIRSDEDKYVIERTLEEIEKSHIIRVLQHVDAYEEAARILGIDPATLWRKRKRYNI
jgi:two-component system, NtrC family, response regulator AlgB